MKNVWSVEVYISVPKLKVWHSRFFRFTYNTINHPKIITQNKSVWNNHHLYRRVKSSFYHNSNARLTKLRNTNDSHHLPLWSCIKVWPISYKVKGQRSTHYFILFYVTKMKKKKGFLQEPFTMRVAYLSWLPTK